MIDSIEASKTIVAIATTDRQIALKFALQQPNRERATQVYLNTLAVLTVKRCLDLLEITTDLAASDCWNPFCRLGADLADLKVAGVGYLECRPVAGNQQECLIPPEALENRIGYLVVQLQKPYQEATILGFVPKAMQVPLPLSHLQPLSELFVHLENLRIPPQQTVSLRQWLNNTVDTMWQNMALDAVWQTVDDVLVAPPQPSFAFRNIKLKSDEIQQFIEQLYASQYFNPDRLDLRNRDLDPELKTALIDCIETTTDQALVWKAVEILWTIDPHLPAAGVRRVMDLGLLLGGQQLALLVAVLQPRDRRMSVLVRVYPLREQRYVPAKLQLRVLSADGNVGSEVQAREHDNYIQLIFRAEFDDRFSIRITLEADSITEYFVV